MLPLYVALWLCVSISVCRRVSRMDSRFGAGDSQFGAESLNCWDLRDVSLFCSCLRVDLNNYVVILWIVGFQMKSSLCFPNSNIPIYELFAKFSRYLQQFSECLFELNADSREVHGFGRLMVEKFMLAVDTHMLLTLDSIN